MNDRPHNTTMAALLSGGLDSSIMVGDLLRRGRRVQPFFIRGGLAWEAGELAAAQRFLERLACERLQPLVVLEMPLGDLYGDHWSVTGRGAPGAESADAAVFLPGRNALLVIKAAIWCQLHEVRELALGVLGSSPFDDAQAPFFHHIEAMLARSGGGLVRIVRPLSGLDKRQVMQMGRGLPLEWTFSCVSPVDGLHCGVCNKCAERIKAFRSIGMADPTPYAQPLAGSRT